MTINTDKNTYNTFIYDNNLEFPSYKYLAIDIYDKLNYIEKMINGGCITYYGLSPKG